MPARRIYASEIIIGARQDYADGKPTKDIAAKWGISIGTLYQWVKGEVAGMNLPVLQLRRPGVRRLRPAKRVRLAVVKRLWHVAEQQVREIDERLARGCESPAERSRDVRELAGLVRSLRELAAFDERDAAAAAKPTETHDDECRDIDEFRRDLVRQMDALVARRTVGGGGQPEGS